MAEQRWHADKRVPIALIFAIAMQSGVVIWWAADMSAKVDQIIETQKEDREGITKNSLGVANLTRSEAATDQRLISIEASQRRVETSLSEILRYLRDDGR
jgi:hypothetical protein